MTDIMETTEQGVSWQIASEANYAEQLTRNNMARYYQSRAGGGIQPVITPPGMRRKTLKFGTRAKGWASFASL